MNRLTFPMCCDRKHACYVAIMQILKKSFIALAAAAGAAAVLPAAVHAEAKPLVYVIGGFIAPGNMYEPLNSHLRGAGFDVEPLWLTGLDHRADANRLKGIVDGRKRTNPSRDISILTHSNNALVDRYYLKVLGGSKDVKRSVVLGGVEYGSPTGCMLPAPANQSCNGSALINQLNAGLDTPGPTEYYSIRSTRDPLSGDLDGRQCRASVQGYLPAAASVDHAWLGWDPRVVPLVISSLKGTCPGQWVTSPEGSVTYENSVDMNRK
ncbi:Uncharacterised protein (plasmid) [Tsukamurella tyrosinosolvens]|uniref:Triacylglycerol lipase n=2 Tax=Tsukamurella tyrosinosolvens TaxID=57704 RepID=A0A1H4TZH1_TSUTY|nr:hypothetical protein AXK58_14395 [Tsukamurella tyrosinosolvens]SEC61885.1 hypothetical protein SAMN04489793_2750 [Tsukamurella tyrosinosolvens]VEH93925.1 Uncharacterised protein [Tsukamurella tyrosinosolvens]